ncbi:MULTISPECIES: pyridoxal 5'-phosphate synthase glutaminase subunit PdxT [Streptococcus]|uniref:Pyridoxal 5'-phosphate synthase subunit PdxT n=1 Tax=Streptococcus oralis subsp. oralis TaxID=1891914 RepID=A0A7H9FCD1_STROR|nr:MULTISPECIES: pyridoxal 5'-phosphate synthase glutaminase subunit PdxT [Streptococcus]EIC79126.1 pyridoxal 5'-phosphate synthase, glutaminase subunit Pdx2 [Streptococcus oralis SK10]EKA05873.1 glutamine amidotransferase subunit PdxT [Streptococcus sp. GMD6S]KZX06821.1 pyridoxal 5'-phosphate synthase subunit PdxT [Streptococcus oralis]MBZ2092236.1 pyridoxal 5'-phosphate synthase glutaminase subunit PdxT [Streptococcus oralis]MDO6345576.1 pyridoxal 5'-phosphate synthase glutaminase subunit Pd
MKIGILALQGAFEEHAKVLEKLGVVSVEIRNLDDFQQHQSDLVGLILPGGESTTMGKLLRDQQMLLPIREAILSGLPVFGTCAGLILLAKEITSQEESHLATMDIVAERNAYGRQLGSFYTEAECKGVGQIFMTFIRGPIISSVGEGVEVLATVDDQIVAAQEKNMLVTSFHPELTDDARLHQYFINMCKEKS